MKCTIYTRKKGCSCYAGPLLRLQPAGQAWSSMQNAPGHWGWWHEAPDQPQILRGLPKLAASLKPLELNSKDEFEQAVGDWDEDAFAGSYIELVLFQEPAWPLSAQSLAEGVARLDAGLPSNVKAFVITIQDQTFSLIYFSSELQAWIDRLVNLGCGGECREKPYERFRLRLSEMLPLTANDKDR